MTHYRWQRRQDPGGATQAIRQLSALSLDPREEVLFRMDRITHYGPSQYSQCQDPTGRHATIHAELVPQYLLSPLGEKSGRRLGYNGLAGQDAADGAEGAQAV
jgi:hypothetical protein